MKDTSRQRNLVAKYAKRFNKAAVHVDKRKQERKTGQTKQERKHKGGIDDMG